MGKERTMRTAAAVLVLWASQAKAEDGPLAPFVGTWAVDATGCPRIDAKHDPQAHVRIGADATWTSGGRPCRLESISRSAKGIISDFVCPGAKADDPVERNLFALRMQADGATDTFLLTADGQETLYRRCPAAGDAKETPEP
jgi:hypothetical protein